MSEYLKMADVFKGVVICSHTDDEAVQELQKGDGAGSNFHLEDDGYWLATTEDHVKHAAHAINHHDALVDENEKLRELLTKCLPYIKDESDWGCDSEMNLLTEIKDALLINKE